MRRNLVSPALICAAVPFLLATAWAVFGVESGRLRLGGDEPHYLIAARSWVRDHDFDVRNDYAREAREQAFVGDVTPHATHSPRGWFPFHMVGLSLWVAYPMALGGVLGARLAVCVFPALLGFALHRWLRARAGPAAASWLTLAMIASLPVAFGGSQLYPDLPGGVLAVALFVWLVTRIATVAPRFEVGAFALIAGLLPWLHLKLLGAAAVLALGAAYLALRRRDRGAQALVLLAAVGPLSLGIFQERLFGNLLGFRSPHELTTSPARALLVFLGLHFDQSQGMFVQQPLLLLGVPALAVMARSRPRLAIFWALLYGSLVLPNALEVARFGGHGPIGRFGWCGAFLWVIPLGEALSRIRAASNDAARARSETLLAAVAMAAVLYNGLLAMRWTADPSLLLPNLDSRIWARDSLVADRLRYVFPSFYFWDLGGFLWYRPNALALAGTALLAGSSLLMRSLAGRRVLVVLSAALAGSCVMLLPAPPPPGDGSPAEAARTEQAARAQAAATARRFEAECMAPPIDRRALLDDPAASGGAARSTQPERADHLVTFGPYVDLPAGNYRVELAIRALAPSRAEYVGLFDVVASRGKRLLAARSILADELLTGPGAEAHVNPDYVKIAVAFGSTGPLDGVELRFVAEPGAQVALDFYDLIPVLAPAR